MRRYRVTSEGRASIKDVAPSDRATITIDRERMATVQGPSRYRDGSLPIVWVTLPWSEVTIDSVSWSRVSNDRNGGWLVPRSMQWGDYGGSTYDRSNYEVFCETFASDRTRDNGKPNWLEIHGGHGSHGIAIALSWYLSADGASVREFLGSLEDYCLADDEHHSELEMRLQSEAWEDYGLSDLRRALAKLTEEVAPALSEAFEDDTLPWGIVLADELYNQDYDQKSGKYVSELSAARSRHEPNCETATSCHLAIDEWVDMLSDDYVAQLVTIAREMVNAWCVKSAYACLGCRETSAQGRHGIQERLFNHGGYECHYPGCPDQVQQVGPGILRAVPSTYEETTETTIVIEVGS